MTDEAQVRSSLQITKDPLEYSSKPTMFLADVSSSKGATPGNISVNSTGVDVDLSELSAPGLCRFQNLDDTYNVDYGIWDGVTLHKLGRLLPGEFSVLRLCPDIGLGIGTAYENLRFIANTIGTDTVDVLVEAFET